MKCKLILLIVCISLLSCNNPVKNTNNEADHITNKTDQKLQSTAPVKSDLTSDNTKLEGIDISQYQSNVDWNEVKNDNISFVFIKSTGGETYEDPSFTQHWTDVKKAGLKRGAYHFYYTKDDPVTQAKFFISKVLPVSDQNDLPPIIDIEREGVNTAITVDQLQKDVQLYLNEVEKAFGRKPILYTSSSFAKQYFDNPVFSKYYLWLAEYDVASPHTPAGWVGTGWTFWQNNPTDTINGIQGSVDHDVFKGGMAELNSL